MAITTQQKTDAYQFFAIAFGAVPGVAYLNQLDEAYTAGLTTKQIVNIYTKKSQFTDLYPNFISNEQFAISLIANVLGSSVSPAAKAEAQADITASLNGGMSRGDVIFQIFTNLAAKPFTDPLWGSTAKLLANQVAVARYVTEIKLVNTLDAAELRAFLDNVTSSSDVSTPAMIETVIAGSGGTGGNNIQNFTLTTGQDIVNGTAGNDVIRGVAGQAINSQDQTTLNSSDVLNGGGGNEDTLALLLNGNYGGGATISNIETLQIATNSAAVAFDFNVNQGNFEVTGVNTIVYDQITTGETLTVNNLTPSSTAKTTPELKWANELNSAAGTIGVNYRQESTNGAADVQKVTLQNVNAMLGGAAQLNIGAGIETITIKSSGSMNTLNNSGNVDAGAGSNGAAADIISSGSLTKVILEGDMALGKTGGVIAVSGLTDRAVGSDNGSAAVATSSNLLSVGSRVTEVDASAMTAAANVRFVAKTNGTGTDVTFKGGSANDYVEFELGKVTATGGAGNDTFAFVNTGANATFAESDTIGGGVGSDTIQFGLNGAGTFNISETELRNKTSIETLDMRGAVNNLTLSSDFVNASDTVGTVTVRTDKIVQSTSDTSNTVANGGPENAATSTVDLTKLSSSQGVTFIGGSGSDRIILNDSAFNAQQVLDGGSAPAGTTVGAGRFDTLTVTTSGGNVVLDAADLSNVKNFEGLVLTKNSASATYNVTLTRSFMNANTQAVNDVLTTINDTNFQVGTSAAANNSALSAGDTVTIDVRDLLNATDAGRATGFTVRTFDITSLENAGVTVNFAGNTGVLTTAQVRAAGVLVANGADAALNDVVVASAANPNALGALFFQGTVADESVSLAANGNSVDMGAGNDNVNTGAALAPTGNLNGGAGFDTLNAAPGVNLSGATITSFETLNVNGAVSLTAAQYAAFTTVNAPGGADTVTLTTAGNIVATAAVERYNLSDAGNGITLNGNTTQRVDGGTDNDTVVVNGSNIANKTITLGLGADTLTISSLIVTATDAFRLTAASATGANVTGVETVNLQTGIISGTGVLTMFDGAGAVVNLTGTAGDNSATDALKLGTGGQTVNVAGDDGFSFFGNTGQDTFNLSGLNAGASSSTINQTAVAVNFGAAAATSVKSLVTSIDTIVGFRAGIDKIDSVFAGGANQLTTINVAVSTSLADLAGTLGNSVNQAIALAAANWNAAGDALLVNVATGTAAGTYFVQNAAADATFDAGAELVLKLVGTTGVFTQADVI